MNFRHAKHLSLIALALATIPMSSGSAQSLAERAATDGEWQALPDKADSPEDNPTTESKVALGKKLFFDPRLSLTGTVSCNTCHNLMEGGDDGRPSSMGVHGRIGPRNAPTVWNSVFQASQFWDGRSPSLEDQAKGPIVAAPEMGMPAHEHAIKRIAAIPGYQTEFREVFESEDSVTIDNLAKAIAAFERTLITPNSAFDRYVRGETSAMTHKQIRGMELFSEVGCTECHSGPAFNGWDVGSTTPTFEEFPRNVESQFVKQFRLDKDLGRFASTNKKSDKRYFKVPTLRNVTLTSPYFHNGAVATLTDSVRVMGETQLDTKLSDEEVRSIIDFLETLEGEFPSITMPRIPSRPGESVIEDQEPIAIGE